MAERFVRGWSVDLNALQTLVGAGRPSAEKLLESTDSDLFLTLGQGDEREGEELALEAFSAIVTGQLDPSHAYRYARVTEPVLDYVGTRLSGEIELVLTYYLPNRDNGCWETVLEVLAMPVLAGTWAVDNLSFPWPEGEAVPNPMHWPIRTALSEQLAAVAKELGRTTEAGIRELPAELLVEDPDWLERTGDELFRGLGRLREWVERALHAERSLVLVMDGDQ